MIIIIFIFQSKLRTYVYMETTVQPVTVNVDREYVSVTRVTYHHQTLLSVLVSNSLTGNLSM